MESPRLFRLAPEALTISASFRFGEGWSLAICVRRGDETWDEADVGHYTGLTTPELVDVVGSELARDLGL